MPGRSEQPDLAARRGDACPGREDERVQRDVGAWFSDILPRLHSVGQDLDRGFFAPVGRGGRGERVLDHDNGVGAVGQRRAGRDARDFAGFQRWWDAGGGAGVGDGCERVDAGGQGRDDGVAVDDAGAVGGDGFAGVDVGGDGGAEEGGGERGGCGGESGRVRVD